jgi:hypothetical protein
MKIAIAKLLERLNRKSAASDVEEEFQFHVEMLEHKYAEGGMSSTEARVAAFRRFGDLERYKRQCVAISLRNNLLQRALKFSAILFILAGLAISAFSSNFKVARIGHLFILNAILGRLFLYVRTRKPECS